MLFGESPVQGKQDPSQQMILTSLSSHYRLYIQFPTIVTKGCDIGQAVSSSLPLSGNYLCLVLCPSALCQSLEIFHVIKPRLIRLFDWFCFHRKDLHKKPNSPFAAAGVLLVFFSGTLHQESMEIKSAQLIHLRTDNPTWTECYLVDNLSRKAKCWTTYRPTAAWPSGMALWTHLTLWTRVQVYWQSQLEMSLPQPRLHL